MFKKPQRPGHRSRVPVMEGALGKEPFVQRPSSAPDLLVSWGGTGDGGLRHPQSEGCSISLLLCGAGPIPQLWVLKAGLPACPPPQFDTPEKENLPEAESPVVLRRCSLTSSMGDEEDDGFMEILDEEEMKVGGGGGECLGGAPTAPESWLQAPTAPESWLQRHGVLLLPPHSGLRVAQGGWLPKPSCCQRGTGAPRDVGQPLLWLSALPPGGGLKPLPPSLPIASPG